MGKFWIPFLQKIQGDGGGGGGGVGSSEYEDSP